MLLGTDMITKECCGYDTNVTGLSWMLSHLQVKEMVQIFNHS